MASTVNVSNFELLVKPIITSNQAPNRTVIQGYFLTISNPSFSELKIQLSFTASSPNIGSTPVLAFWDVDNSIGTQTPLVAEPIVFPCIRSYTFTLPALDTGLFLLQPDITIPEVISNQNIELRGYARITLVSNPSFNAPVTLLLSAQQRGTFLPQGSLNPPATGDYDQLAYDLPLANGGSEVTLDPQTQSFNSVSARTLPSRERIFKAIETNPFILSNLSNDPLIQQITSLDVEEQKRMVSILLERFQRNRE